VSDGTTTDRQERPREASGRDRGFGQLLDPLRVLLANRSLAWLLIAFGAMTVAEWGYVTALAIDAFRLRGGIAVGLVGFRLFFAAASSFLCIPFVERHPGGRMLTAIACIRAAIVGSSCLLASRGGFLVPLLLLVALDAVVSALYRPAQSMLLPILARTPKELAASSAGLSTVKTLSQAVGGIAGGFLMEVTTPAVVFGAAAIVFLGAGAATSRFVRVKRPDATDPRSGILDVVRDTLAVVRHGHVAGIVIVSGLRTFVRGMWLATAVIASLRLLHAGSAGVGLLMLAAGVGSLAAVPLSASLIGRSRLGTPAAVALIGCGIPLGLIAGVPILDVALLLVTAWGVGMAVADVATSSLLLRMLPSPLLPRATGAIESSKLALEGIGALFAPFLVAEIGVRGALVVAGLPLPVVVIAGWKLLHRVDADASERAKVLELLHGAPCLQPLDMVTLDSLASRVVPVAVPANTDVVRQGEPGDCFYVIESGTADVLIDDYRVGQVTANGSFGEKALLRNMARTATVRSIGDMKLFALSQEDFLTALTGQRDSVTATNSDPSPKVISNWNRRERVEVLSRVSLLSHLDSSSLEELAENAVIDRWPKGARIIRQGDEGDRFFVLLEGRAEVLTDAVVVNELYPGDQFGEIALLHEVTRRADVTATCPVTTLSLGRDDFVSAVRSRVVLG
jgi:CRP-like cAMP-binding protein